MLNYDLTCIIVFIEIDSLNFLKEYQKATPQLMSSYFRQFNFCGKSLKSPSVYKKASVKDGIEFIGGED